MLAVVYQGIHDIAVREVPDAAIEEATDAVIRVTSSAICGSDLHMYDGRPEAPAGLIMGHEPLGLVEQVGSAVRRVTAGMRVVVPTHLYCGVCYNCARGFTASCMRVREDGLGAAYGYAGMGHYPGAWAELLRVPYADANCVPVPGTHGDDREDDFVLLADAFVTGWHAAHLAQVSAGDTVAVFGAGAVGLLAAYSSVLRGAAAVFSVDQIPERLAMARALGAVPIDFTRGDPVELIIEYRRSMGLPLAEKPLIGTDVVIDAVGFQALDRADVSRESATQVISDAARLVNPNGRLGVVGVYPPSDPRAPEGAGTDGSLSALWGRLFSKSVSIGFGRTNDRQYTALLRDLVTAGRARPGAIVSHHGTLEDAPALLAQFRRREHGVVKAVLQPQSR
jgi:glutathione-independent formaldehyde dehydrogenase